MSAPIALACSDAHFLCVWSSALKKAGYQVLTFEDPLKALEALEGPSNVRILITGIDFGPGKPNGIVLARMLRNKRRDIRIIFVAPREFLEHAEGLGEFRSAPLLAAELTDTIRQLVQDDPPTVH